MFPRTLISPLLRLWLLGAALACCGLGNSYAQQQERGLLDRIDHPDRTLEFHAADKKFGGNMKGIANKEASTRSFGFSRSAASVKGFHTSGFAGAKEHQTKDFAYNDRGPGRTTYSQGGKGYATKEVPVKTSQYADRGVPIHDYPGSSRETVVRGKEQGRIDDLIYDQHMTVDQVRDLLNKNH